MATILVTGATGNVGREVTAQLVSAGVGVRAFVRDARACRFPEGVEVAEGDLPVPGTLEATLSGIEAVFLVWPFLSSDGAPAVLPPIAGTVRRLVYLSSSGVNDDTQRQTDPINQLQADMESLIEASGRRLVYARVLDWILHNYAWYEWGVNSRIRPGFLAAGGCPPCLRTLSGMSGAVCLGAQSGLMAPQRSRITS